MDLVDRRQSEFSSDSASGGGLDILVENHHEQYIAYEENRLMLSDGLTPHRISRLKKYKPGEKRITMQGHLIRRDKVLEAYF